MLVQLELFIILWLAAINSLFMLAGLPGVATHVLCVFGLGNGRKCSVSHSAETLRSSQLLLTAACLVTCVLLGNVCCLLTCGMACEF